MELLGVARHLARRETVSVAAERALPLRELVQALGRHLPALVGTVLEGDGRLIAGHVFSRNGTDLLRDPEETVHPGDRLLLLSTSAGG